MKNAYQRWLERNTAPDPPSVWQDEEKRGEPRVTANTVGAPRSVLERDPCARCGGSIFCSCRPMAEREPCPRCSGSLFCRCRAQRTNR